MKFKDREYYKTNYYKADLQRRTYKYRDTFDKYEKPQKQWENDFITNENIDRIKLPCFCTYEWRGKRRLGMIIHSWYKDSGLNKDITCFSWFTLIDMSNQSNKMVGNLMGEVAFCSTKESSSLESLINAYKINIGKVEINYYEVI